MKAIINSSPLIAFGGIKKIDILNTVFSEIIIPQEVYNETIANGKDDEVLNLINQNLQYKVVAATNIVLIEFLNDYLDKGEAEVIALAKELDIVTVIIDEAKGRKIARRHGLDVVGSLGTLMIAKNNGVISSVREHMDVMIQNGIRIGDDIKAKVLKMSGEQ